MIGRPTKGEYRDYYDSYISKVPDGDILDILAGNGEETSRFFKTITEEQAALRYAPGKWSIREVLGHVTDIERVFQYRALIFARGDRTPQASIEQDDLVAGGNFDDRSLKDIVDEFQVVRLAGLALFRSFDGEIWMRRGTASGFDFTVRAIPYILAGHEIHHVSVIKERYL